MKAEAEPMLSLRPENDSIHMIGNGIHRGGGPATGEDYIHL